MAGRDPDSSHEQKYEQCSVKLKQCQKNYNNVLIFFKFLKNILVTLFKNVILKLGLLSYKMTKKAP